MCLAWRRFGAVYDEGQTALPLADRPDPRRRHAPHCCSPPWLTVLRARRVAVLHCRAGWSDVTAAVARRSRRQDGQRHANSAVSVQAAHVAALTSAGGSQRRGTRTSSSTSRTAPRAPTCPTRRAKSAGSARSPTPTSAWTPARTRATGASCTCGSAAAACLSRSGASSTSRGGSTRTAGTGSTAQVSPSW